MGWYKRLEGERGVSTAAVVASLIGLFAALVVSLDAGHLWTSRRGMVTATDTAALAGARTAVGWTTPGACPSHVESMVRAKLIEEQPSASLESCTLAPSSSRVGYVTVDARRPVDMKFGMLLGLGQQSAFSSTSVQYGYPTGAEGLRPIAICVENPHIQEWLRLKDGLITQAQYEDLPRTEPTEHRLGLDGSMIHRIFFTKENPRNCNGGSNAGAGNWGWMDYDNNENMNNDLREWLQAGYQAVVQIHEPAPACTAHDRADGCVNGTTGSRGNSLNDELTQLFSTGITFWIPVFDNVQYTGENATFTIRGFVGMILHGYKVTGAERDHYMDVEFTDVIRSGGCCASSGLNTGALATRICTGDHDPLAANVRCAAS